MLKRIDRFIDKYKTWKLIFLVKLLLVIFLTEAIKAQSPGGVSSNLYLWLKADKNVTGSAPITVWGDNSPNGVNAFRANGSTTLLENNVNFNPSVNFPGNADFQINNVSCFNGTNNFTVLFSSLTTTSGSTHFGRVGPNNCGNSGFELYYTNAGVGSWSQFCQSYLGSGVNGLTAGYPNLLSLSRTGNATASLYYQGASIPATVINPVTFASNYNVKLGSRNNDIYFNGKMQEVIIYSAAIPAIDLAKIHSYLAIKYGVTLDQTSTRNYLASDGSVIWDAALNGDYKRNIIAIGKDSGSDLEQRISHT